MTAPEQASTARPARTRARLVAALGCAAMVATGTAACGGSSGNQASTQPTATIGPTSPATSPPATVITAPPATTTVTKSATSAPTVTGCTSAELSLRLGEGQGAAGTQYDPLVLTNTSSTKCTLYGYPGVSFVAKAGRQVGLSAARASGKKRTVVLEPGSRASALLGLRDGAQDDNCGAVKAKGIRFYPPGETHSLFVADPVYVCTNTSGRTSITVLQSGTDPQP